MNSSGVFKARSCKARCHDVVYYITPIAFLPFLRLPPGHPVADARLGEGAGGVFGVDAQLAPEAAYGGPHGANVGVGVKPPDPAQQGLVGQQASGVGRELGQRPVLLGGQRCRTYTVMDVRLRCFDSPHPPRRQLLNEAYAQAAPT